MFEFVDPDVQVRVCVKEPELLRCRRSNASHLVLVLPDGGGQPADPGASSAGPLLPPQSLPGGLPQRRPVSHDASLHVLPPSVAQHQPGADNQGLFSSRLHGLWPAGGALVLSYEVSHLQIYFR